MLLLRKVVVLASGEDRNCRVSEEEGMEGADCADSEVMGPTRQRNPLKNESRKGWSGLFNDVLTSLLGLQGDAEEQAVLLVNEQGDVTVVQPNEDGSYWRKIVRNKMVSSRRRSF